MEFNELDSDYEEDGQMKLKRSKSIRFTDDTKELAKDDPIPISTTNNAKEDTDVIKPTSLQQRMLAISGQNIDEFMKEMENVQKKKELERAADLQERLSTLDQIDNAGSDASECEKHKRILFMDNITRTFFFFQLKVKHQTKI